MSSIRWHALRGLLAALALLLVASYVVPVLADEGRATPLPAVSNSDPFFGAVQAIYAPEHARQSGVRWQRLVFWWSQMQPDSPEQMTDSWFSDVQIAAEIARGITPVGVVLSTPGWAARDPGYGAISVPKNLHLAYDHPDNYWGQYMRRLALRYRGRIDTWIIWNEPDMYTSGRYITWAGTDADYFQLLKVAYLAIKDANPSATVVMSGLTYWWDKENERPQYFERVLDHVVADPLARVNGYYFDVANVHTYGNPLNSFAVPAVFQRLMRDRGIDKPIWITELNAVPYDDPMAPLPTGSFRATMDQQASYIIQALALARAAGVQRASVYKLADGTPENGEYFGLVREDGSVRPAYVAYQVAATYFSNIRSATYTWTGSHNPPSQTQLDGLIDSGRQRYQFIWPGQISRVVMERERQRVTVVWNNYPEATTITLPASTRIARLVDKYGQVQPIESQGGTYSLRLEGSTNNSDPRDPSIYLIGGSPLIVVEDLESSTATPVGAPSPLPSGVDAKIQIVWPHGNAPVAEASRANVTAYLFHPGSPQSVACSWEPTVRLWAAINNEPASSVAVGRKRIVRTGGGSFPAWDFDDVNVSAARDPQSKIYFFLTVDGVTARTNVWSHGADARTYFPTQDVPTGVGEISEADARIQIVWPHRDGLEQPVLYAPKANLTVALFQRNTFLSAKPDWTGTVRLFRSLNNGPGQLVANGQRRLVVTQDGLTYPVWDFPDVDVSASTDPQNKYYFWVQVDGMITYPSVWSHGLDARTYFPHIDVPLPGCE